MNPPLKNLSPLCQLAAGATGRVCELKGDESFCQRLREMGFGEAALVTKVSGTTTSLCQINGTRIALSHGAAMNIMIELLPISPAHAHNRSQAALKPNAADRVR
jgi:ferrous iron transport protein A